MSLKRVLKAVTHSKKFVALEKGALTTLPSGEQFIAKLTQRKKIKQEEGTRFADFSFEVGMEGGGFTAVGVGEDDIELIAYQKAIAEAFERLIFFTVGGTRYATKTTNGWAAHVDRESAEENARSELFERDAVILHWLTQTPLEEVEFQTWPRWLKNWTKRELSLSKMKKLRVLITTMGELPVVVSVIEDDLGFGICSHATGKCLEESVYRALVETMRIADIVALQERKEESRQLLDRSSKRKRNLIDHALLYAYHEKLPRWLFGKMTKWPFVKRKWNFGFSRKRLEGLDCQFELIVTNPIVVGYCKSDSIQKLYFGRTEDALEEGLVNLKRLHDYGFSVNALNLKPHFVA